MSRPTASAAREQIAEIVGQSVYHALGLLETLGDERNALESQDMFALDTALEQKGGCVSKLRHLERERNAMCCAAGFPAGPDQMDQVIAWCDEDSALESSWQHLMDIAIRCSSRNLTNGAIIRGRKQQIETSLAVIRGGDAANSAYNRDGSESGASSLRSIAEA